MPPSDTATANTPLAPSVEKAYYRKCIELKRRLNEVEAANNEARTRRERLDRGILKMRLERAFLLEQLGKRMQTNVDNSEGSGDEEVPPPDRPHRDKRRRPRSSQATAEPHHHHHHRHHHHASNQLIAPQQALQILPSQAAAMQQQVVLVAGPTGAPVPANAQLLNGQPVYDPSLPPHPATLQAAAYPPQHHSPYGAPVGAPVGLPGGSSFPNGMGFDGADEEREPEAERSEQAANSFNPPPSEDARTIEAGNGNTGSDEAPQDNRSGGFTAVNG